MLTHSKYVKNINGAITMCNLSNNYLTKQRR